MATMRQAGPAAPTTLGDALAQIVRRLRLTLWHRLAARGALVAACSSLLVVGLAHRHLLPAWLPFGLTIPLLLFLGVGIGTLLAFRRPLDPMAAARHVEARLGLKERLSSALEFERSGQTPRDPEAALLLRLQQEDAAAHAAALCPEDAVPLCMPWEAKALLPAFLLLVFALVLPALTVFVPLSVRSERAIVQASGEELTRTARVIQKRAEEQGLPTTRRAAQDLQKLGEKMTQGRMDKKQAMVQMSQVDKKLADAQRRMAQTDSGTAQDGKSLADAGRQLAQSFQPTAGGADAEQASHGHENAGHAQGKSGPAGRGIPSRALQNRDNPTSPEMQQSAQTLKQGSASALSRQLRDMAQRIATHPMSDARQKQTAQDLQKLSEALKGSPLSEAQKHVQSAADAMKRGEAPRAAAEMNQSADAADRQARQQQDAEGMKDAHQSLQNGEQKMAQASQPADITRGPSRQSPTGRSSVSDQQKQGQSGQMARTGSDSVQGQSDKPGGTAPNGTERSQSEAHGSSGGRGTGLSRPGPGRSSSASGQVDPAPSQGTSVQRGAAHPLDPKFNPKNNPKYGKIYLGAGSGGLSSKLLGAKPGAQPTPGQPFSSSVPYYDMLTPARKSAETAMDKEDIPPAYRSGVRKYFDSLPPAVGNPPK